MSIQQNFPAISPSLNLNFARSKTLDPRITFSRTTTATRVNEQGLVEVVSADIPRFDHEYDASTGVVKSLGLLIEESRINYEKYTEDPTQWSSLNMIPTGNTIILPTGVGSTAIEYRGETTDANNKLIRPLPVSVGISTGDTWTYSGFYKKGTTNGERYVHIILQNNTADEGIGRRFDFDDGDWESDLGLNNVTVADSGYEKYPNGWYRIWLTCTFPSAAGGIQTITRLYANSNSVPYDTSFSLWGAQLEKASFPSSYIPNDTESQKTRNPDNVSMTGDNFSDWYNQSEGTLYVRHKTFLSSNPYNRIWAITDGSASNVYAIYYPALSTKIDLLKTISGSQNFASGPSNANGHNNFNNTIFSYDKDTTNIIVNGGNATTLSVSGELNLIRLNIGGNEYNSFTYNHISQLTYYPRRLTDTQLQNLTK